MSRYNIDNKLKCDELSGGRQATFACGVGRGAGAANRPDCGTPAVLSSSGFRGRPLMLPCRRGTEDVSTSRAQITLWFYQAPGVKDKFGGIEMTDESSSCDRTSATEVLRVHSRAVEDSRTRSAVHVAFILIPFRTANFMPRLAPIDPRANLLKGFVRGARSDRRSSGHRGSMTR
jgi:hypothetical protein